VKKKILSLAGLAVLVAVQAATARNAWLCWRARGVESRPEAKISLLRRADRLFPWNDAVPFELGKAYFQQGAEALGDPAARDRLFGLSLGSFLRSLRLNPASPAAHFELGQTLLYLSYLGRPASLRYFDEYRRAAELTGHNSQIRYDAGKVLLGRWPDLTPDERDFVAGLLRSALAGPDEDRLADFLETWNVTLRDYDLAGRVLPDDAGALRTYARFLGERALSLEARQAALAKADALEVARARAELDQGRREADSYRPAEASARCAKAVEALGAVRFYQDLAGRPLFDPREYAEVRRGARRLLAMNRIDETRSLADRDGTIAAYLAVEDDFTALSAFETFIKERGLLAESDRDSPLKDLEMLAFRLALDFQLNRYRDIARTGALLSSSSIVIAPSGRPSYVRILKLIGESNFKLDNVYEAERYYRAALETVPDDLGALLGLERCYGRLNDEAKAAEIRRAVDRLTSPPSIDLGGRPVPKGGAFKIDLVTGGGRRTVRLEFAPAGPAGRALVSVFLDGRVVWEGYGDAGFAEFAADLAPGSSTLETASVSDTISLVRLTISAPGAP